MPSYSHKHIKIDTWKHTVLHLRLHTAQRNATQHNKERQETALTVPLSDPPPPVPVSPFRSSSIGGGGAFVRQEHRDLTKRGKMSQQTKTA